MRLSRRLIVLSTAIVGGWATIATAYSSIFPGGVALFPAFAVGTLAGGALSARLTRRRTVIEGAIAAVLCGVVTAIVNLVFDEFEFVTPRTTHTVEWIVGVGLVCLVGAIIGGRLGERVSDRPVSSWHVAVAFGAAMLGSCSASLLALFAVHDLAGETAMFVVQIVLMIGIPIVSAALVTVIGVRVTISALFAGAFAMFASLALWAIIAGVDIGPMIVMTLVGTMATGLLAIAGRGLGQVLLKRWGPVETEKNPAKARALG